MESRLFLSLTAQPIKAIPPFFEPEVPFKRLKEPGLRHRNPVHNFQPISGKA
jgi:hypothetical protein